MKLLIRLKKLKFNIIINSSKNKKLKNVDIFIVDTFGESKKFYKIATSVFLGGSIIKRGGQNPLEPARFGAKILHGPNIDNFKEVYKLFKFKKKFHQKLKTPLQCANSVIFKKNMRKVKKMKSLGKNILKNTLNELDKSINNEI